MANWIETNQDTTVEQLRQFEHNLRETVGWLKAVTSPWFFLVVALGLLLVSIFAPFWGLLQRQFGYFIRISGILSVVAAALGTLTLASGQVAGDNGPINQVLAEVEAKIRVANAEAVERALNEEVDHITEAIIKELNASEVEPADVILPVAGELTLGDIADLQDIDGDDGDDLGQAFVRIAEVERLQFRGSFSNPQLEFIRSSPGLGPKGPSLDPTPGPPGGPFEGSPPGGGSPLDRSEFWSKVTLREVRGMGNRAPHTAPEASPNPFQRQIYTEVRNFVLSSALQFLGVSGSDLGLESIPMSDVFVSEVRDQTAKAIGERLTPRAIEILTAQMSGQTLSPPSAPRIQLNAVAVSSFRARIAHVASAISREIMRRTGPTNLPPVRLGDSPRVGRGNSQTSFGSDSSFNREQKRNNEQNFRRILRSHNVSGPLNFQSMASSPRGFGGVVFGNELQSSLPSVRVATWVPFMTYGEEEFGFVELALSNGQSLQTNLFSAALVADAHELVFNQSSEWRREINGDAVPLAGITGNLSFDTLSEVQLEDGRDVNLSSGVMGAQWSAIWLLTVHPEIFGTRMADSSVRADAIPNMERSFIQGGYEARHNSSDAADRFFAGDFGQYKIIDLPMRVAPSEDQFVEVSVTERGASMDVSTLLSMSIFPTGQPNVPYFDGFEVVSPYLVETYAAFRDLNEFAEIYAILRAIKQKGAIKVHDAPSQIRGPLSLTVHKLNNRAFLVNAAQCAAILEEVFHEFDPIQVAQRLCIPVVSE